MNDQCGKTFHFYEECTTGQKDIYVFARICGTLHWLKSHLHRSQSNLQIARDSFTKMDAIQKQQHEIHDLEMKHEDNAASLLLLLPLLLLLLVMIMVLSLSQSSLTILVQTNHEYRCFNFNRCNVNFILTVLMNNAKKYNAGKFVGGHLRLRRYHFFFEPFLDGHGLFVLSDFSNEFCNIMKMS